MSKRHARGARARWRSACARSAHAHGARWEAGRAGSPEAEGWVEEGSSARTVHAEEYEQHHEPLDGIQEQQDGRARALDEEGHPRERDARRGQSQQQRANPSLRESEWKKRREVASRKPHAGSKRSGIRGTQEVGEGKCELHTPGTRST